MCSTASGTIAAGTTATSSSHCRDDPDGVSGTVFAALAAIPLAFSAARSVNPAQPARFGLRRLFDLLCGVDGLIWAIILSRAFGPEPMTGGLAIALTDTGAAGKLFCEAVKNADDKQMEGVASTGAGQVGKQIAAKQNTRAWRMIQIDRNML
ncbi:MAG: hypothetical protein AAGG47_14540 [Pseudomonadota bacterium]